MCLAKRREGSKSDGTRENSHVPFVDRENKEWWKVKVVCACMQSKENRSHHNRMTGKRKAKSVVTDYYSGVKSGEWVALKKKLSAFISKPRF